MSEILIKRGFQRGSKNPNSKLTEENVSQIKYLISLGQKCKDIAKDFNIHPHTISLINKGKTWSYVPSPPLHPAILKMENKMNEIQDNEFQDLPEPVQKRASNLEKEYRIQQIMKWKSDGIMGKKLAKLCHEEFKVSLTRAYDILLDVERIEYANLLMSKEELQEFCKKRYLSFTSDKDKNIALKALDRLAKHSGMFPSNTIKVEALHKFDSKSDSELEQLAKENDIDVPD